MKRLFVFLAAVGLASVVAMVVGCHGMLESGSDAEIFREATSLISGRTGGTSAGNTGGGGSNPAVGRAQHPLG